MNNLKAKRVIALKKVGVARRDVEEFRKSCRDYLIQYRGYYSDVITPSLLQKVGELIEVRREMGIEIAGVLFEDNLTATFIFYVDGDPENAWFERNSFFSYLDFTKELERQIKVNFIPDMSEQKHVFCKNGKMMDMILF